MVRAIERGINLCDFENLTIGMIINFISTYNDMQNNQNTQEKEMKEATQSDYDAF